MKLNRFALWLTAVSCVPVLASAFPRTMRLDADGMGDVLIFPYFNAQDGQQTLFTVSNSGVFAKAVKVRVRHATDGRVLAAMNLYLGVDDTWTGAIHTPAPDSAAVLTTTDDSCTVPSLRPESILTTAPQLADGRRFLPLDGGGATPPDETREGYIEVQVMVAVGRRGRVDRAASRDADGRNCHDLEAGWLPGGWLLAAPRTEAVGATGNLYGRSYVVRPTDGTVVSIRPAAIAQFSDYGMQTAPSAPTPNLMTAYEGPQGQAPTKVATRSATNFGDSRTIWNNRADAITAVLMRSHAWGEINLEPAIGAQTEWLMTNPLVACRNNPDCTGDQGGFCSGQKVYLNDREGLSADAIVELQAPDLTVSHCAAVEVWAWGQTGTGPSALLRSLRARRLSVPAGFQTGHARLEISGFQLKSTQGHKQTGAPLIGHAVEGFLNVGVGTGLSGRFVETAPLVDYQQCDVFAFGDQIVQCAAIGDVVGSDTP